MKRKAISHELNPASFAQQSRLPSFVARFSSNDLFWLLVCCGARLIFFLSYKAESTYGDSQTYLNYGANILHGHVDILRTPVYPCFIKSIKLLGEDSLIENVAWVQAIISITSIIIFYGIVREVFRKRAVILMATYAYGIMPSLINFDKCILTESLSISAMVVFLYFIIRYLKRPTIPNALLFTLFVFFTIMLRPSFIILLPVVVMFWILRMIFFRADRGKCLWGISGSIVCVFLLLGYSGLNFRDNRYKGISVVTTINRLDNVINADMYMHGNDPEISEMIKVNLTVPHGAYSDMYFNLSDKFSHERVARYLRNCIINQPGIFIKDAFGRLMTLGRSTTKVVYTSTKGGFTGLFLRFLAVLLSVKFFVIYILLLLDLIYIFFRWFRDHQVLWFKIVLFSIITANLITIIAGAQGEYNRLFVIVLPCLIILIFGYIDLYLSSSTRCRRQQIG